MRKSVFKTGAAMVLMAAMATGLPACKSTKEVLQIGAAAEKNPGPCPRAFALYDASRIVEFTAGGESFKNVGFTGEINQVRSLCRYYGAEPIRADLEMEIAFGRGPAAASSEATYEYFVAVTRKNIDVIEKQVFPIRVRFPAGSDRVVLTEEINDIVIPRRNENTSGVNFEIIVGFVVTDAQRAFNAEGKRFRISAGQN